MSTLKYPSDLDTTKNDFIKFTHFPYQLNDNQTTNGKSTGTRIDRGGAPPQAKGSNHIILYMPNTTPSTQYGHDVKIQTFAGPLGKALKGALGTAGTDFSNGGSAGAVLSNFDGVNVGEAGYHFLLDKMAGIFGQDAATALALGQNKVFNPNAEMIYKQPLHRKYNFTFDNVDYLIKTFIKNKHHKIII